MLWIFISTNVYYNRLVSLLSSCSSPSARGHPENSKPENSNPNPLSIPVPWYLDRMADGGAAGPRLLSRRWRSARPRIHAHVSITGEQGTFEIVRSFLFCLIFLYVETIKDFFFFFESHKNRTPLPFPPSDFPLAASWCQAYRTTAILVFWIFLRSSPTFLDPGLEPVIWSVKALRELSVCDAIYGASSNWGGGSDGVQLTKITHCWFSQIRVRHACVHPQWRNIQVPMRWFRCLNSVRISPPEVAREYLDEVGRFKTCKKM